MSDQTKAAIVDRVQAVQHLSLFTDLAPMKPRQAVCDACSESKTVSWVNGEHEAWMCDACITDELDYLQPLMNEIEVLRTILRAFSFNHTTLRAKNGDPIYTAVGSLTGDQQGALRLVLNAVDSGRSTDV